MNQESSTTTTGRWWSFTWPPLAVAGGLGALELLRGRFQRRRMFLPERYPEGTWDPGAVGLDFEDLWFESGDGVALHGWWLPARAAKCTVLYCHGQTGALGSQVPVLEQLTRRLRANVFAFDYRGYGRSGGSPDEKGLYRDVRAAHRQLTEGIGEDPRRVVLFGHSLGGAVAIDAALEVPVAGLVAQATFTQMRDMAKSFYPNVPLHLVTRNHFRSIDKVGRIAVPKLFVHGERDDKVPLEIGRRLYEAAAEPKEWLALPRRGHHDLVTRGGMPYWLRLLAFCQACVG
jgi:hypothetical protein